MASEQVNQHYKIPDNHDVDHDEDGEDDDEDEDDDDNSDDDFNEQVDQPQIQIKSDQSEDEQGGGTRNGSPESLKGSLHQQHGDGDQGGGARASLNAHLFKWTTGWGNAMQWNSCDRKKSFIARSVRCVRLVISHHTTWYGLVFLLHGMFS